MKRTMRNDKSLARDAIYNTVGSMTYLVCLWLITVLVVRLSGYEDAGMLSVAITLTNVFLVIANYGMRSFQASDVQMVFSDGQYIYSRFVTVLLGVVLCVAFSILGGYIGTQFWVIQLYMLFKAAEAFSDVLFGVMQRQHSLKYSGISMIIKGVGSVVGFVLGFVLFGKLIHAIVLMFMVSMLTVLLYDLPVMKRMGARIECSAADIKSVMKLLAECFPLFVVCVAPMVLQATPKLLFEKMYTTSELGIYSSVSAPTVALSTLVSCILMPFLPMFAEAIQEKNRAGLLRLLAIFSGVTLTLGVVACVAARFLGGWALSLLFGRDMDEYTVILIWVLCAVTLTGLLSCLNALFISGRKLSILAVIYIAADVVCLLISKPLLLAHGILGITDTLIITQLLQCIVLVLLCISLFFRKSDE